jgi:hypothetical protein
VQLLLQPGTHRPQQRKKLEWPQQLSRPYTLADEEHDRKLTRMNYDSAAHVAKKNAAIRIQSSIAVHCRDCTVCCTALVIIPVALCCSLQALPASSFFINRNHFLFVFVSKWCPSKPS